MSLSPGTRLGVYDVVAALGAGAMGEVYRARDTKLGREAALKILPEDFARAIRTAWPASSAKRGCSPHPAVERVVRRSLQKDPMRRLQHLGDARLDIEEAIARPDDDERGRQVVAQPAGARRGVMLVGGGLALAILLVALGTWILRSPRAGETPIVERFVMQLLPAERFHPTFSPPAFSPDGEVLVFTAGRASRIYVRRATIFEVKALAGTEGARYPFLSPDGQWVGFFADRMLKKVSLDGGLPQKVCDALNPRGGVWLPDGTIVFAPFNNSGLSRVSASGGTPTTLTKLDAKRHEFSHRRPDVLPDGRTVLFSASTAKAYSRRGRNAGSVGITDGDRGGDETGSGVGYGGVFESGTGAREDRRSADRHLGVWMCAV